MVLVLEDHVGDPRDLPFVEAVALWEDPAYEVALADQEGLGEIHHHALVAYSNRVWVLLGAYRPDLVDPGTFEVCVDEGRVVRLADLA